MAPLEAGVVRDGEITDTEALTETLRGLYRDNRGLGKNVRIGVANQKIVVRVDRAAADHRPRRSSTRPCASTRRTSCRCPSTRRSSTTSCLDMIEGEGGPRQRVLLVAARRD